MAYRIFRDSRGTEWQTWDVVPRLVERRVNERRLRSSAGLHNDRRGMLDRRIISGQRSVLASDMGRGWLCFAGEEQKRRLSPIPADWERCPTAKLEQYCAEAIPARRTTTETRMADMR